MPDSIESDPPVVVKISGTLLKQEAAVDAFWASLARLRADARVLVVHGGGAQMTALADRLGHEPRVVQGRRVTTDVDLEIAQWMLCGEINTELVAQAGARGLTAVGLTGVDAATVRVAKRPAWEVDGEKVDFGWVGDVQAVDPDVPARLLEAGVLPVMAPLGVDGDGQVYNVNADTVAHAVAGALGARSLLFVTAAGGVCGPGDGRARLSTCDADTAAAGIEEGWIEGGMRVKVETALDAVRGGVDEAFICGPADLLERADATRVTA
jgi:acetylglutamate kinase